MKKIVIPFAVLLGLLLLGSTSLAARPEAWVTEFISDVFAWSADDGSCTITWYDQDGPTGYEYTVVVEDDAPMYPGAVLLRPYGPKALTNADRMYCSYPEGNEGPFHIRPGQPVRYETGWVYDEKGDFEGLSRKVTSSCEPTEVELEQLHELPYIPSAYSRWECSWTIRP